MLEDKNCHIHVHVDSPVVGADNSLGTNVFKNINIQLAVMVYKAIGSLQCFIIELVNHYANRKLFCTKDYTLIKGEGLCRVDDVLKPPPPRLLATDRYLMSFGVGGLRRILYFIVIYLYLSCSGSITSVGEERANLFAIVYL